MDDPDLQQKLYDVINDEIERIDYFQNNTSFLNKEAPFIEKFQELIKELFLDKKYDKIEDLDQAMMFAVRVFESYKIFDFADAN